MRTSVLAWVVAVMVSVGAQAQLAAPPPAVPAVPPAAAPAGPPPAATPASPPPTAAPMSSSPTAAPAGLPPPAAATADLPVTAIETPVIQACVPNCRSGFTCVSGSCISSCNPPCAIGDVCSEHGECLAKPIPPLPGDERAAKVAAGVETHDGFFLRLTTGPAGGAVSLDVPDQDERTWSGGGWGSSIDIGGAVVRDLVVFGRLRVVSLFDPKVRVGDETEDLGGDSFFVTQGLFGAGLNYYVMPINIYFGGTIGFATLTTERNPRSGDTQRRGSDVGFGIDLDAGKEWWVGDNWGLGVALRLSLASIPAGDDFPQDAVFGSGFVSILFSATYQ
jgi:hypothetical protein